MVNPLISVIIPAYAHAHFIGEAIRSVVNQSFTKWELIIINDGSPDNTGEVVKPFLSDSRIQYFEQINQGQSAARNFGISLAKGEFIHLLDDDDWLPSDALEWQIDFLNANTEFSAVIGKSIYRDETGAYLSASSVSDGAITFSDLFDGNAFDSPGQALFRHDTFKALGGFDPSLRGVDDYDFMFRFTKLFKVAKFNCPCLNYRVHSGNASRNKAHMLSCGLAVAYKHLEGIEDNHYRGVLRSRVTKTLSHYAGPDILREFMANPFSSHAVKSLLIYFSCVPVATSSLEIIRLTIHSFRNMTIKVWHKTN